MNTQKIIDYWLKSAEKDLEVAASLFNSKHYLYSLFFDQLVAEKALKALVVKTTGKHARRTHQLLELAKVAKIPLKDSEVDFLDRLTSFNLEARYPDFKLSAYKKATPLLAKAYLTKTKQLFLWLKNQI